MPQALCLLLRYRILFEKDGVGSSNLEHVFEDTLTRIGRMVAILDDWYDPTYLTRIWTIFEQFTAIKLGWAGTLVSIFTALGCWTRMVY